MNIELNKFQQIFRDIINGKSLRKIEIEYDVNRESILKMCRSLFPKDSIELEKFEAILQYNIEMNLSVNIPEQQMKEVIDKILSREITVEQASTYLHIDKLTLTSHMEQYILKSGNKELQEKYKKYKQSLHPNYSHINFKALLIEMLRTQSSQAEIANKYDIPARTISRKLEKLKDDEYYKDLYEMCKEANYRNITGKKFTTFEIELINRLLDKYNEGNVIIENSKSDIEKRYEKSKKIVQLAESTEGTFSEKANAVGLSQSTLRRTIKFVKNYELLQEKEEEKGENKNGRIFTDDAEIPGDEK